MLTDRSRLDKVTVNDDSAITIRVDVNLVLGYRGPRPSKQWWFPRRGERGRLGLQAEVHKDLLHRWLVLDHREQLPTTAAAVTYQGVDSKRTLEK